MTLEELEKTIRIVMDHAVIESIERQRLDIRLRMLEDASHTRIHAGLCSNFNAVDPDGRHKGVEACGCNHIDLEKKGEIAHG